MKSNALASAQQITIRGWIVQAKRPTAKQWQTLREDTRFVRGFALITLKRYAQARIKRAQALRAAFGGQDRPFAYRIRRATVTLTIDD